MRILVVTQYYYPEVFKSTDLAENLVKRGHQVTVLTGLPNYPTGKIFKGYGYFKRNKKIINGVRIVRTWIISRGNGGKLGLILNYVSWPLFASARAITLGIRHKYDVIIGMYHDQVLSPMKALFNFDAINITLGLPFTRISPDHGPNYSMLGKNLSDPKSLIQALKFLDK